MTTATIPEFVTAPAIDARPAEGFVDKLLDILNGGALSLLISLGNRTGLYDTLAGLPLATSAEVARASGLNELYVHEWLGAMVKGGIVIHDADMGTYTLPAEHAAFLTRAAASDNLAVFAQYIPVLGQVEDELLKCFESGGGVPYSSYSRFHEVMAEDSGQTLVAALEEHVFPLVPGLTGRLERGIEVLDVGCGSGRVLALVAHLFPASRFTGYDLSEEVVAAATAQASREGLGNLTFEVRDVTMLDETGRFDLITAFNAIHDQARPDQVLAGIHRALKDDGTFLMQENRAHSHVHGNLDHPTAAFLYTVSCMHCVPVSLAQGGMGLGAMWGRELAERMLRKAGFASVSVHEPAHDIEKYIYAVRKS